jgi:hypothetical protein
MNVGGDNHPYRQTPWAGSLRTERDGGDYSKEEASGAIIPTNSGTSFCGFGITVSNSTV